MKRLSAVVILVSAALLAPQAGAQVSTASLSVQVVGEGSDPLPGVTVEVLNSDTGLQRNAITDDSGGALILALPPGTYEIAAQLEGMITPSSEVFQLMVGQRAQLTVALRPQVSDAIEVTGEAPLVDVFKMDSSTNIIPEQIETLPVRDRQYERLAFLAPGTQRDRSEFFNRTGAPVTGSVSNSAATAFLMDGVEFTDNFFGLARVRVSQDAIEEFRVIGFRFDSEIGGSAGGAISVVTKSGGNALKGSAFGFYRGDSMRAKGALEENDVDFTRYHLGFTVGGPITTDKFHYFLSAEYIDQNDAAFFRPGGDFFDQAEDIPHPLQQNLAFLSLDHQFGSSSLGIGKFFYERYREENYQVGGVRNEEQGWGVHRDHWNGLLGHTWVLGATRLNEARLQIGGYDADWPKNSDDMGEAFSQGSTLLTGRHWSGENRGDSQVLEIRDTFHLMTGLEHQIKAGFSYLYLHHDYLWDVYDSGEMTYLTDDRSLPIFYTQGIGSGRTSMSSNMFGVFAQDDWLATESLTVSLGLRYDVDIGGNNPDFEHPLLQGARGTDWNAIQPRFGFTWDLTRNGRNVLRGGAGIFNGRYLATPSLTELMLSGGSARAVHIRLNGTLALELPPEYWLSVDDPENTGVPLPPSVYLLGDSFLTPQSTQYTLGYGRQLGSSSLRLDIEGIYADGKNEPVLHDANWAGNDSPGHVHPDYTIVGQWVDEGRSRYKALQLSLNGTLRGGHILATSLTLADKKNIQDDSQTSTNPSDSADLEAEWGRSLTDERFRFVLSAIFRLPWNLTLAPFYEYGSGQPWNHLYGYDFNGDFDSSDRPPGVSRNDRDGPSFRQFNLRLTKTIPLGKAQHIELILETFNVFNTTNFDVGSADGAEYFFGPTLSEPDLPFISNPEFGTYRATHAPREFQIGLRFGF